MEMYDLETLKLLASHEYTKKLFGSSSETEILWKGGNWVLLQGYNRLYGWNTNQSTFQEIKLDYQDNLAMFSFRKPAVKFDGDESVMFCARRENKYLQRRQNLRTNETFDWSHWSFISRFKTIGSIKNVICKKYDNKCYLEKFDHNWELINSVEIDMGGHDIETSYIKITSDYIFMCLSDGSSRLLSVDNGSLIMPFTLKVQERRQTFRVRCLKNLIFAEDVLLLSKKRDVFDALTFNHEHTTQALWLLHNRNKIIIKMITPELAIIQRDKTIAFLTPHKTIEIVSDGKFAEPYKLRVPVDYQNWTVFAVAVSETQLLFHVQSYNKQQHAIVVLDYCNSVISAD